MCGRFVGYRNKEEILNFMNITEFASHPVSRQVNAVRNNERSNIKPLEQLKLKL